MEPFDNRVLTPRQISKKKTNPVQGDTLDAVKHFLKTNSSQQMGEDFLKYVQNQIAETHDLNRQANPPPGSLRFIDPPKNPAKGRKRNTRIKGMEETHGSPLKKQRKA
jgi:hypothetical protein